MDSVIAQFASWISIVIARIESMLLSNSLMLDSSCIA